MTGRTCNKKWQNYIGSCDNCASGNTALEPVSLGKPSNKHDKKVKLVGLMLVPRAANQFSIDGGKN